MNLFSKDDPEYQCSTCSKSLRFSSNLATVLEVESGLEHNCNSITKQNKIEVGLESMRKEREIQAELYEGQFHSMAQLSKSRVQPTKVIHERQAITDEHKRNIGAGVRAKFADKISNIESQIDVMLSQGIRNKTLIAEQCNTSWITVRNYMRARNIT